VVAFTIEDPSTVTEPAPIRRFASSLPPALPLRTNSASRRRRRLVSVVFLELLGESSSYCVGCLGGIGWVGRFEPGKQIVEGRMIHGLHYRRVARQDQRIVSNS